MTSVVQPNFKAVIAMMAIAFGISTFFTLRPQDDSIPMANVAAIPGDLGDWRCVSDVPLDAGLMSEMKADSYVDRYYQNRRTGQVVQLMVVYRRYGRREFAHRPEQCYPAGGYNIISKDHTTLPYDGRAVDAVHLVADGSNVQRSDGKTGVPTETLTYFFASGDRTESDFMKQQLLMAFERLFPDKNGWTFLRLSSPRMTTDDDALEAQQDFMRVYGPPIKSVITTDNSGAPAQAALSPSDAFGSFKP
jgi:EpsI family protein